MNQLLQINPAYAGAKGVTSATLIVREQWVNWGIGAARAKKSDLIKYWDRLDLDEWKRQALSLALF